MDAFDYRDQKVKSGSASDLLWNILTVVVLLSVFCVAGYAALIYMNPTSSLNPLPPKPYDYQLPTFTPLPPTVTPTKVAVLPPTWTPAPTDTPEPTNTPRPTATDFITDTPPPSNINPEPTLTPGGMSYMPQGEPQLIQDFSQRGCNWMGVAGQIFDLKGSAVVGLIVQLGGSVNRQIFETQTSMTGLAQQYGPGGYEFTIADHTFASDKDLWIQLVDQAGLPLSNKIYFSTVEDCTKNLVLISFKQAK